MIGSEINRCPVKGRRQAVPHTSFILANSDELLRTGSSDSLMHRAHPVQESLLREHEIVVDAKRVVALIHSSRAEFELTRQRNGSRGGIGRHVPGSRKGSVVGIAFCEPLVPSRQLEGIAVWSRLPQMLRNAGLVDQVPRQERNIAETANYRGN